MQQIGKPLTDRQRQVALCIGHGLTNDEAARELGISPRTAKAHADAIRLKLGVAKRRLIPAALREREGRN
jgi:DNA-binding NarL/FixJ family response regulator